MAKSIASPEKSEFTRTFRNLSREEIADPDKLEAYESMGLGGRTDWDDLLGSKRVLIVSTAGTGKTHECREQAKRLFADGKAAFFLTLEGISTNDIRFLLEPVQFARYRQWLTDGHSEAHFFLDSADELLLSHGDFRFALRKLAASLDGQLHRASIVVTSRPIALDLDAFASELPFEPPPPEGEVADSPDEPFRRLISGEARKEHHAAQKPKDRDPETGVRIVGLTSLSQPQIEKLAGARGVRDVPALIAEIDRKRAWEFARRPQELIEICSYWNEHGQLGTRSQQIAEDIRRKLQETGERKRYVTLSDAKALEGAERLALAQILTRKRTIRFSDLSLDAVEQESATDRSIILDNWPENERAELLQRPLFGFASYGRVRFHHRSAVEYLAAQRLNRFCQNGHMAKSALFSLLFGECYGQQLVFPSMRAVAAWLAIWNDAVRDELLRREPEALMDDGADARDGAREHRKKVRDGIDPLQERQQARAALRVERARSKTFKDCAEAYIEVHKAGWKNDKHEKQWTATLETYAYPKFGSLPVASIDTGLVQDVLRPIWATKTETASRVRGRIESILDWAKVNGYRDGEMPVIAQRTAEALSQSHTMLKATANQLAEQATAITEETLGVDPNRASLLSEIRSWVREQAAKPDGLITIREAMHADREVAAVIYHSPAFLLGLAPAVRENMRLDAIERHLPNACKMLETSASLTELAKKYPAAIEKVNRTFYNKAMAAQAARRVQV